jgi:hypothetical protein
MDFSCPTSSLFAQTNEPTSSKVALAQFDFSNWKEAIDSKYNSLLQYQTWILVLHPSDWSIVGCKWVYKRKYKIDGTFNRYKTRSMAQVSLKLKGLTIMKLSPHGQNYFIVCFICFGHYS